MESPSTTVSGSTVPPLPMDKISNMKSNTRAASRGASSTVSAGRDRAVFDLSQSKSVALNAMGPQPGMKNLKQFVKTDLANRFLSSALLYFSALFKLENQLEALNKQPTASLQEMVENQKQIAHKTLRELSRVYATVILEQSDWRKTQQERQFFELLYDFTNRVMFTIFDRRLWVAIEIELGRIFRTDDFNISKRQNDPNRRQTPLSARELYEIKKDDMLPNRVFQAATTPRSNHSVRTALKTRSPLISVIFPAAHEKRDHLLLRAHDSLLLAKGGGSLGELHQTGSNDPSGAAADLAGPSGGQNAPPQVDITTATDEPILTKRLTGDTLSPRRTQLSDDSSQVVASL
eukprot:Rmarinus@m.12786